jgi:apolipoprotein N-acyltransferase
VPTDDELLRYIVAPLSYSTWWMTAALLIGVAVMLWWIGVFVWTLPAASLRRIPVLRDIHRRVLRRKFVSAIRDVRTAYRGGGMSQSQACTAIARTLRSFFSVYTGVPVQYMSVGEIGDGPLAPAGSVLKALSYGQFDKSTEVDVDTVGQSAERVVATWN